MSMGTYLSSKAEVEVAAVHSSSRDIPPEPSRRVARRDAWVMAAAYAVGSLVPALPFAVGFLGRGAALLVAVALGLAALFVLGYGKAVVSHQRRGRSGVEMLVLASVAGLIGFLVGTAARELFGLDF